MNQYAIIRDEDDILLELFEGDFETAREIALENKSPLYLLDYPFSRDMIGKRILSGSYRWRFEVEELSQGYDEEAQRDRRQLNFGFCVN